MQASGKSSRKPSARHPRPPRPSRLKPAQYVKLPKLLGFNDDETRAIVNDCRELLWKHAYGEFCVDDLINAAVLRIYRGDFPKGMTFPKCTEELVNAVARLGKLHAKNRKRRHQRHGPPPIPLDDLLSSQQTAQPAAMQTPSFSALQLDTLRRFEDHLRSRLAELDAKEDKSKPPSPQDISIEIELR